MDAITRDLQKAVPWTMLYADDVMLACEDKDVLEREVQAWSAPSGLLLIPRTSGFKYLGSAVASDGNVMVEVNLRIPERLKSKIYRAVVRPVAMCGAECWPAIKVVETRLSVMETKMLRWTAGVMHMDRIRNDVIRQKFGVVRMPIRCAKLACDATATFCVERKTAQENSGKYQDAFYVPGDSVDELNTSPNVPGDSVDVPNTSATVPAMQ
ncbi:unnamed protein product [Heligmosomoides polygyrus]|uniref:Reverse transcriptase domain-containing protein n=1 Tax=Heligmosomoides polygyrus TaxID=6339 RepID=A0A183G3R3_HELPZ|nr:unnamed protein product [Heligmosomoides polygyrus]